MFHFHLTLQKTCANAFQYVVTMYIRAIERVFSIHFYDT